MPRLRLSPREALRDEAVSVTMSDLRFALRTFARTPGFTAIVLLTLGLGIGATTAIFSVVNAVLLRPLPYPQPDRLVRIVTVRPPGGEFGFLPPRSTVMRTDDMQAFRDRSQTLEGVAAYSPGRSTWTATDGAVPIADASVSPGLFELLRVPPALGRTFTRDEETPGNDAVVVLSDRFWRQRLGGDPGVVGRPLLIDEEPHVVVGVMPPGFEFPNAETELWQPLVIRPVVRQPGERLVQGAQSLARIADDIAFAQATAEANVIYAQLRDEEAAFDRAARPAPAAPGGRRGVAGPAGLGDSGPPGGGGPDRPADVDRGGPLPGQGPEANVTLDLVPVHEELVAPVRPALLVLLAAVGFVLLIACANVANLMLVRAAGRRQELAVRAALGASRGRLVRQVFSESGVLALLGGVLGIGLAVGAVQLVRVLGPASIPRLDEIDVGGLALAFTAAVSVLTGVFFGVMPAITLSGRTGGQALRAATASVTDSLEHGRLRARRVFTVAEVALAIVLLVGAALLATSFANLVDVDPGYEADNLLTFRVNPPQTRYDGPQRDAFFEQVRDALRATPGVQAAALTRTLPLQPGGLQVAINVEGQPASTRPEDVVAASVRIVSDGYAEAMGLQVTAGRFFAATDRADSAPVLVVNERFANRYFPGQRAVGRTIDLGPLASPEIVGVINDVRHAGLDTEPEPEMYLQMQQARQRLPQIGNGPRYFAVRTTGDPSAFTPTARAVVQRTDPAVAIDDVATMAARLSVSVAQPRFYAVLVAIFGLVALVLAVVGIYGVIAYSVHQRSREIGIRMALGARRREILRLVMRQGALVTGIGVTTGLAGAAAVTRYLEGLLFGLTALDITTFVGVAGLFALVAAAACYLPASRAARIDPAATLRAE